MPLTTGFALSPVTVSSWALLALASVREPLPRWSLRCTSSRCPLGLVWSYHLV